MDLLQTKALTVRFGERLVLDQLTLTLPTRGVVVLMGPGRAGKSTFVRTLAGLNDANAGMSVGGEVLYQGLPLGPSNRPALVHQHPRLTAMTLRQCLASNLPDRALLTQGQQRALLTQTLHDEGASDYVERLNAPLLELSPEERRDVLIVRELLATPALLCLDEPTAGLEQPERIIQRIKTLGKRLSVLFITHNQRHAREVAEQVILLAGGRIQERSQAAAFWQQPQSEAGRTWIRTGGCSVPSLETPPEQLDPLWKLRTQAPPQPPQTPTSKGDSPRRAPSQRLGPRGFRWALPGRAGGCPKPGLISPIDHDVYALLRIGATHLITLTENPLPDDSKDTVEAHGVHITHFPIDDMSVPSQEDGAALCAYVSELMEEGATVIYHCKAGLGRTGTMLAALLIWRGMASDAAIARVREIEPRYIQSKEQEAFLHAFAQSVQ